MNFRYWLIFTILAVYCANGQQYPSKMKMGVTFYDYHADKSNPEFQVTHISTHQKGMVSDTLDKERKPVLGPTPFFNHYVHKWFRPWTKGDFTIPLYTSTTGNYGGNISVDHDTSFINKVLYDSLPFSHIGNGVYKFERSGSNQTSEFFWIDNKGFGTEPQESGHNYSFTMELHTTFTYKPGLTFKFLGDDDVWAYINGRLVMDIGGIHSSIADSFHVDSIAKRIGLEPGKKYPFDFFYAERHTKNSRLVITTNLFTPPSFVRFYPLPGAPDQSSNLPLGTIDTIPAGEIFKIYAHVFDSSYVWQPAWDSLITWEMQDTNGNPILTSTKGSQNTLFPTEAYGTVTLVSTFVNPNDPMQKTTVSIDLYIAPGKPNSLELQNSPAVRNYRNSTPLDPITFAESDKADTLYAIIRDSLGNYIGPATNAQWQSSNQNVAIVSIVNGRKNIGEITKKSGGSTLITVSEPNVHPAKVMLTSITSTATLLSATTRDYDGNGFLDRVILTFDSTISVPDNFQVKNIAIEFNNTTFTVREIASSEGTKTGKEFILFLNENRTKELQTGWKPLITIIGLQSVPSVSDLPCNDGAGAVIAKALFYTGELRSANYPNGTPDTIKVQLSETVNWSNQNVASQIFEYFKGTEKQSNVFLSMDAAVSEVTLLINDPFQVQPILDSLQLQFSVNGLPDLDGNRPNATNKKRAIEYGLTKMQVVASSNPFNPELTVIPEKVRSYYAPVLKNAQIPNATKGIIIGVELKGTPLKSKGNGIYGKATIYDGVGNIVLDNVRIDKVNSSNYGLFWNGLNHNGRIVGNGSYLVILSFEDIDGNVQKIRKKIGIKR